MAHYKTPRYLRIVREFPLTATGKPQKFQMRQSMMDELGLRSPQTA
jgi:fatty-acyl-CoA synthase